MNGDPNDKSWIPADVGKYVTGNSGTASNANTGNNANVVQTTTIPAGGPALGGNGGTQTVTYTTPTGTSYPTSGQGVVGNANGTFAGGGGNNTVKRGTASGTQNVEETWKPASNTNSGTQQPPEISYSYNGKRMQIGDADIPIGSYGKSTSERIEDSQERLRYGEAAKPAGISGYTGGLDGNVAETDGGGGQTTSTDNGDVGGLPGGGLPGGGNPGGGAYGGGSGGGGSGTGSGGSGGTGAGTRGSGYTDAQLLAQALSNAGVNMTPYQLPNMKGPNPDWLEHVSTEELRGMLEQLVESQKQQSQQQIDYGVEQGINELNRAMEDAAPQFQTQRNQIAADEARALDNQALYAEARGDRGGIGLAQYNSIQNTAAQNRRAVNDAQVKLGTDTARQIADLRAKGEFQKADQLLSITQSYLSQLMSLEQWALQTNLSVDQFNSQLQQWVDEYNFNVQKYLTDLDLSAAQLTGVFANGQQTLAAQNMLRESLASSGSALLSAGVMPSRQQLEAMGMTETQAKAYLNKTGK